MYLFMFAVNPDERISMEGIRQHPWMTGIVGGSQTDPYCSHNNVVKTKLLQLGKSLFLTDLFNSILNGQIVH